MPRRSHKMGRLLLLGLVGFGPSQASSADGPELRRGTFGAAQETSELTSVSPNRAGEAGGSRLYLHGTGLDAW